jgi:hypothetical protein
MNENRMFGEKEGDREADVFSPRYFAMFHFIIQSITGLSSLLKV